VETFVKKVAPSISCFGGFEQKKKKETKLINVYPAKEPTEPMRYEPLGPS
jgi:hypothetical protein